MLSSDSASRNKILVVGRRGVGKLSLVQSILGSRFVPTTSVSKSRPSSPLILPAIPVPTLEETIVGEHGILSQATGSTFAPPNSQDSGSVFSVLSTQFGQRSGVSSSQEQSSQTYTPASSFGFGSQQLTQGRDKLDHSGVTIPWTIDTKYYSVQVDFWIDETEAQGRAELVRMIESGELDEMGSVIEAVVFCFSKNEPSTFYDIKPWLAFVERHEPSITLCVATDAPVTQNAGHEGLIDDEAVEDFDDWCLGNGFEFIDLQDQPSDTTEDEHVGLDRIMEALAAHMWDGLKRKSSKKRDQHDRSMMLSFQDDDVDMTYDLSWRENVSRRSFLGLGDMMDAEGEEEEDEEDDEDDSRAFYRALQELNLHNRSTSPTAPLALTQTKDSTSSQCKDKDMKIDGDTDGFDDDFDLDDQAIKALENDEFWSSQDTSRSDHRMDPIDRTLERQFKQFLGGSFDDSATTSSETGGKESSSGDPDDISFELNEDGEFEFGNYVVSPGPGGELLQDLDLNFEIGGMSTPNQESIKSMHKALFGNIDEDDGMSQTIATLQGLREQGKTLSENERRELAARVALSFGMQLGE